jgi:hypothetical protein
MIRNSITLLQYAGYLLVIALASVFYNPAEGSAGFNKHGLTGLYVCGGAAALIAVLGVLTGKGKEGAAWAGLVISFVLLAFGGQKLFSFVRDIEGHALELIAKRATDGEVLTQSAAHDSIVYRAIIFGALFIFSLLTFLKLGLALRRGKTA